MRRAVLTILSAVFSFGLFGQGLGLLDKAGENRTSFVYTYSLSRGGEPFREVTSGKVTVEDNAYYMEGLGLEVTSDGITRLSVDRQACEAVLEKVEKEDMFTNPALFISSWKNYRDRLKVNGSGKDFLDVTLILDDDTLARFVLTGIVFSKKQGLDDFRVTAPSGSDWLVTDLRQL
ncbi:MAG: hypothetical protein J5835_06500 [Bacteroidales bacterium]|nr:hypothetical protein [Bacteroidales bacterium]